MYSCDETVNAVLRFYHTVLRHPYLDSHTLIVPPLNGWTSIDIVGENGTVLDLLRHLPYLRLENAYRECIIHWETIPICYSGNQEPQLFPYFPSLPAYCFYLARAESCLGASLILETKEGTITEFCPVGSHVTISYEEYEALPEAEKWTVHRTTPITEFLDNWTQSRALSCAEEELLMQQGQLEPRHVQDGSSGDDEKEGSELDREQHKAKGRERRHVADVYNTYLRHGWPDHFDKERCKAELLELEKRKVADERRQMAEVNPDAALFD